MRLYTAMIDTSGPRDVLVYAEPTGSVQLAISGEAPVRLDLGQAAQLIDALRDAVGAIQDAGGDQIGGGR